VSTRSGKVATEAQDALIESARRVLESDDRVIACWLEGSFARGNADAWSDVDLHVVVADDDAASFLAGRREVLERIAPVLVLDDAPLPWGAHLVLATLKGPARLDLYVERESKLNDALRFETPRVLFDRKGIADTVRLTGEIEPLVRRRLKDLMRTFFFGAMWPGRLLGRREWGTLFTNAGTVIFQFMVPAMLIQDSPEHFYRPPFHNERFLSARRRETVNSLVAQVARAFSDIDKGEPAVAPIVAVYERMLATLWTEFRAASEKYGVEYMEAAELETRAYLRRELGMFASE
jgi:predicted nucleotidyltransferase